MAETRQVQVISDICLEELRAGLAKVQRMLDTLELCLLRAERSSDNLVR
jgi:hypothetical protein